MNRPLSTHPTFSQKDIVEAYKNYDASEEAKEPILYFISELTGMSVDSILERMEDEL